MTKIAVLGAAGQLGRHVVENLLDQGAKPDQVAVCVRTPEKAADLAKRGLDVIKADYDEPETLRAAFTGADMALLIPTFAAVEDRVIQHNNALVAAKEAGVKRIVFASFAASQPHSVFVIAPFMLYAESKTRNSGMEWTIMRDGMYLDPVADWAPELLRTGHLPYPVKQGRVAYVTRADLGRAIAAGLLNEGHSGKVFDLTGPEAVSMPELAEIIGRAGGKEVRFERVNDDEFVKICVDAGDSEYIAHALLTLYRCVENGDFENVTNHIELLTGTAPESVESYLTRRLKGNTG